MLPPLSENPAYEEADRLLQRLQQLGSNWPSELALRSLSPQVVEALIERFAETEKYVVPGMNIIAWISTLCGLGSAFGFFVELYYHPIYFRLIMVLLRGVCGIGLVALFCARHVTVGKNLIYPVYALTQTDDVRILPTLVRAMRYDWGKHSEVFRALQRLLKLVKAEHAGLLDEAAQYRIWNLAIAPMQYQSHYNEPLAFETVRALAHIGNAAALGRMRKLANQTTMREPHRRVIETAKELVPLMEARLKRQQVPETLLRAADIPTSQPETLLRATHAAHLEPPQQLLRASTTEEQETEGTFR